MDIMVVDDHSLIRKGLKLLLKSKADLNVTAEAASAEEALEKLAQNAVQLMILDISMPGMGGLKCIEQAKKLVPKLKIIILSMHEEENYIKNAMQLGANGYIPKASADDELLDAVNTVSKGKFYLGKSAEQSLLSSLFAPEEKLEPNLIDRLSPREHEVFRYLVHGFTVTEIAAKLHLSVKTVDTHKTKIMDKLECKKRNELVSLAIEYGLLNSNSD